MNDNIKKRLIEQGFSSEEVNENKNIINLSRWTPFSCAILGIVGLLLQSPVYFLILALLTLIGPFRPWSFYDYLYKYFFSHFIKLGVMPKHSLDRKIGCAMGTFMYLLTSAGFYTGNVYLSYIPCILIISIAIIAGLLGWCFVTSVHKLFVTKGPAH